MKVSDLKKLDFSALTLENQIKLVRIGRPMPDLNWRIGSEVQQRREIRVESIGRLDKRIYQRAPWLCGCEETNAIFCFVCLLFGGDRTWTQDGARDLKNILSSIAQHENSNKHRHNFVSFQLLSKGSVAAALSAEDIQKHNNKVAKNRNIASRIIDILRLCGTCCLSLRGHDGREDSKNRGVFLELVDHTRKIDLVLSSHMDDAELFKATPKTIQNEFLQCMLDVCRDHIAKEISTSSFLSLMVDDVTDVSAQAQIVLILRYELHGKVHERFWGFVNPERHHAESLAQCILQQLDSIVKGCPDTVIAQTYDGATAMGVDMKIKEKYKHAHYTHCYAHQLNKLLEQAMSDIPSVRVFFANLNGIAAFFSQSPDRRAALQQVCDIRVPRPSQTTWKFQSRVVQTVLDYKDEILECFENIELGIPKKYNTETVQLAAGFGNWLENSTFLFWLNFFSKVMPHVDTLSNQLQAETDAVKLQIAVDNCEKGIIDIKQNLVRAFGIPCSEQIVKVEVFDSPDGIVKAEESRKKRRLNNENLNLSAKEACDAIISQVRDRFAYNGHLHGAKLFQSERYSKYTHMPPVQDVQQFCQAFPTMDMDDLIGELDVFYARPELTGKSTSGCLKTLNLITSLGLDTTFKEITKALKILVTIPMATPETERCVSALERIKSYLRNAESEDRLAALTMLAMEHPMIEEIPNFNEKVIEKFSAHENRPDFSFI